jgi:hypothetical protein
VHGVAARSIPLPSIHAPDTCRRSIGSRRRCPSIAFDATGRFAVQLRHRSLAVFPLGSLLPYRTLTTVTARSARIASSGASACTTSLDAQGHFYVPKGSDAVAYRLDTRRRSWSRPRA